MHGGRGLSAVRTEVLVDLLRAVHRGTLPCPLTTEALTRHGMQAQVEELSFLRDLDQRGVISVVVAVIAERRSASRLTP